MRKEKNKKKQVLTVIIPAFNEEQTIDRILEKITRVALPDDISTEIIVVDDCSTDQTGIVVKEFVTCNPEINLKFVKNENNRGKGYCVRKGISLASGTIIIIQDADLENDPEDYTVLIPYILSEEYKVVYGSRFLNKENKFPYQSFYWGGKLLSAMVGWLFSQKLTDEPTCYKMFDATLLKSLSLKEDGFGFCPEVTAKVLKEGYRIKEVPIHYYPRTVKEGKKIKWKDGLEAIWILFYHRIFYQPMIKGSKKLTPKALRIRIALNVAASFITFILVSACYKNLQGYKWVYDSLLKGNYKVAIANKHLTPDERREMKLGFPFRYLTFLKENTPEDAVIWMPEQEAYFPDGEKSLFTPEALGKMYRIRVLHPRRIVDAWESGNEYADKITHVAIINGRGYEKLSYEPQEKKPFAIYPINNHPY